MIDENIYWQYSKLDSFKRKVNNAESLINLAFSKARNWYVSTSWGKDSISLVDMVRNIRPEIEVVFIDGGIEILEIDRESIESYVKKNKINLIHLKWSKLDYLREEKKNEKGDAKKILYNSMFAPLNNWLKIRPDINGVFMGLRREESKIRYLSIGKFGPLHEYQSGSNKGLWRSLPLFDWKTIEVGAYVVSRGLPILDIYKKMGFEARSGMFGFGSSQFGRFAYLKHYYPDLFNKYAAEFPEIRKEI